MTEHYNDPQTGQPHDPTMTNYTGGEAGASMQGQAAEHIAPPEPRRLDPGALRKRRAERLATVTYVLQNTEDEPVEVTVKRPDIFDADTIRALPTHLSASIFKLMEETRKHEGELSEDELREQPIDHLINNYGNSSDMAEAFVLAGFVEPRAYDTPEEADREGGVWVKDVAFSDRIAFMNWCNGRAKEVTDPVAETFPEGPGEDRGAGPDGAAVSGTD